MNNETFMIPKEISSRIKLFGPIYFDDILVIVGIWYVFNLFSSFVYPTLNLIYIGLSLLLGLVVTRMSKHNPDRYLFMTILYKLKKKREPQTYLRIEEGE